MHVNRRECLGLITLAIAGGTVGLAASRAEARRVPFTYFGYQAIGRGDPDPRAPLVPGGSRSYLNIIPGEGCNSLYASVDGAWLLVDTKSPPFGKLLREHFVYFKGGGAEGLVVNTHHHVANTGGNHAFKGLEGIDVLSHPQAATRVKNQHILYRIAAERRIKELESQTGTLGPKQRFIDASVLPLKEASQKWEPQDFMPTKVMDGEMDSVTIGSKGQRLEIELYHFGPAHTDGDVVVRLPKYNLMCVGDLCAVRSHAHIDRGARGNSRDWQKVLKKIIELCDQETIIVPAQGELTDVQGLKDQISYFDHMRESVRTVFDARKQRREAELLSVERFKEFALPEVGRATCGSIYDELVAERREQQESKP